jgi:hypothetical protein
MSRLYRALLICCCVLVMTALVGCTASQSSSSTDAYHPVVQPGLTWADAEKILLDTVRDRNQTSAGIKSSIENNKITITSNADGRVVSEFGFYALLGQSIVVDGRGSSVITLPGLITLNFADRGTAEKAADALYFMQQDLQNLRDKGSERLAKFEPVAAQYRALETKPQMSEEQRKLVVQANALTEKKQFFNAREKYLAALALDPTSYPGAYFNLALLEAQMNLPFSAIAYMKQYLLLVPDAKDARSAQDKIYEWELLLPELSATTNLTTDPPDALLEVNVSDSGKGWVYLGRAPKPASFGHSDAKDKSCLIRASKPGYVTEERSFAFAALPGQVHIPLRQSGSDQDTHGYLGINFVPVTEESAKASGLQTLKGVAVKETAKGSPGERAGLQPGDIILAVAGKEITETIDLPRVAASTPIGEAVELNIRRKGQAQIVTIKIGKLPD